MRRASGEDDEAGAPPPKRGRGQYGPFVFKILGSEHVVAALIGRGGAALRDLQEATRSKVDFSNRGDHFPDSRCRVMTIRAESSESVEQVLEAVADGIQEAAVNLDDEPSKGKYSGDCRVVSLVAGYVVGALLGKGGEDMRRLRADLQCYIEVEKAPIVDGHQRVEIRGEIDEVKRALKVVNKKVQAEVHRDWFPGWAAQDPLAGLTGVGGSRGGNDSDGPSPEELADFRDRYPVDDRAWHYFISSSADILFKVVNDFKPKPLREGHEDYSALLTSFVASVAKRFQENPSGFRKTLAGQDPDGDQGQLHSKGGVGGGGSGRSPPRPLLEELPPSRDATALMGTLQEIPMKYLGYDYAISCDLPAERCKPIHECMDEVGKATHTQIEFRWNEAEGTQRLHVTGRMPDVYDAHLRLMWAFNDGEEPPQNAHTSDLQQMQDQIATLQAQLDAVKTGGKGGGGIRDRGNRGRNGYR